MTRRRKRKWKRAETAVTPYRAPAIATDAELARNPLIDQALQYLCPWTKLTFPGLHRHLRTLVSPHHSWSAFRDWRSGRRRIPGPIARRLAQLIRAHAERGLLLADQLNAYADTWIDGRAKPAGAALAAMRARADRKHSA